MFILTNTGNVFSQNLIAHYPFDNNASDISGNKNDGKIFGGIAPASDRFGNPCGALFFNGIDGYIEVPNSNSLKSPVQTFSVSCWFLIKNNAFANNMKWLTLICKGTSSVETPSNPQYRVQTFQSAVQSTISINTDFTEYDYNFMKHEFQYNKWNFYTLVYDGQFVKEYLNGSEIWRFAYNKFLVQNDGPLLIAKDIPGSLEYFSGCLDDLRIYSSAISASQISQLYNETSNVSFDDEFILNCPKNITTNSEKDKCSAIVTFNKPVLEINCGNVSVNQIGGLTSGSEFPVGTNTLIYEAESKSGLKKTCYSKIDVVDKEPPVINCMTDTSVIITDADVNEAIFNYQFPSASDNCSHAEVKLMYGLTSGSLFPVGPTQLKFTATDESGNISECNYTVTVNKKITNSVVKEPDSSKTSVTVPEVLVSKNYLPDSIKYTHSLVFNECSLTLLMFDDSQQDSDVVSVFFNGEEIVKEEMIKLKKNGTINRTVILNPNEKNDFIVKAWNIGKIFPNTMTIEFYEGDFLNNIKKLKKKKPIETRVVHSKPGIASAISLSCKNK